MPWHWLRLFGLRIGVPVVPSTIATKNAPHLLKHLDQIASFHSDNQQLFNFMNIRHLA